jgi:hypothetical protein
LDDTKSRGSSFVSNEFKYQVTLNEEDYQLFTEMMDLFKHVKSKKGKIEMMRDMMYNSNKDEE